jgi:hypothetical protein
MRIVDDAHRDTSAFALDTRTEYSGCLAEDGSPRPRPNASRHKFAAAISWLAAHLIESFAAYGEAMYGVGYVHHCPGVAPRRARPPEERPSLLTVQSRRLNRP